MLYYIYIGNGQTAIDHLSKVTDGMFVTVSCADKAAVIIDGIRERYNTSILYEQTAPISMYISLIFGTAVFSSPFVR